MGTIGWHDIVISSLWQQNNLIDNNTGLNYLDPRVVDVWRNDWNYVDTLPMEKDFWPSTHGVYCDGNCLERE